VARVAAARRRMLKGHRMRSSERTPSPSVPGLPAVSASPPESATPPVATAVSRALDRSPLDGLSAGPSARLVWRLDEVARCLGLSRRSLERERAAGRFPPPYLTIGRMPLWRPETVRDWTEGGGRR
jgi:hypothetical protein